MTLWIKGCPKCGGDMYSDSDVMGYYRQCLQCGFTFYEQRRREACHYDETPAAGPLPQEARDETSDRPEPAHSKAV